MECSEESRCRELAKASTFYRAVYSEIEEVGWENLVRFGGDLTSLSFRVLDSKGRVHVMEIQLDKTHPTYPPSISADVPYLFNLKWSSNSRLKDVVQQFRKHLEKLQTFWSTLDDIDRSLCVVEPKQASPAVSNRQVIIGNDCFVMLSINATDPRSLPECRFIGTGQIVNLLRDRWQRNSKRWVKDKEFLVNLETLLETQLPKPADVEKNDQQVECGICYAPSLPMMSSGVRVELGLTIYAIIPAARGLFIAYVSWTGCVPLPQQGSHLMFYLEVVHTVQNQLQ
ncbi:uncharacterized protein LOC133727480 isoform X4 [Rosa rugosa]|uniref:uncharacterized protein LOC133727480 isoform X4 n=1 Tax=Rosa rugosa TaxID=74645 RepID=UPI002B40B8B8|nr:uncharacterized protein LOC133727480 isoform X4 [Rosa rugosa]